MRFTYITKETGVSTLTTTSKGDLNIFVSPDFGCIHTHAAIFAQKCPVFTVKWFV